MPKAHADGIRNRRVRFFIADVNNHPCWGEILPSDPTLLDAVTVRTPKIVLSVTLFEFYDHALLVDAPPLDERMSEDPDDEIFLAAVLAANARLIVSGDTHLLRVSGWRGIEVLKARPFVDRYITPADI